MPHVDAVECLQILCAQVGFDFRRAKASIAERMQLLAEHGETFEDARRMTTYAHRMFEHYADKPRPFTDVERRTVVLGCLFSDVGKTGPEEADEASRRLIVEMFAVEGVDDDQQPVSQFLQRYFPDDAAKRQAHFEALGLDAAMSIRNFWNQHADWTLAIAETAGLPLEAVAAAASHHLLDDVNPRAIVGDDSRFTRKFGENDRFDRAEKLVILLDKYDAIRRRGRRNHAEAIVWLRERIGKNQRFRDDPELATLLAEVDAALGDSD